MGGPIRWTPRRPRSSGRCWRRPATRARAVKLVGCWDRDARGHTPKLPFSIYKLFFLCEATGEVGSPQALETLEVGWFGLDELPELSAGRINAFELGRIVAHHRDRSLPTEFD